MKGDKFLSLYPTQASIEAAKEAARLERARIAALTGVIIDDDGRIALQVANSIAAAVYGPRGELRD